MFSKSDTIAPIFAKVLFFYGSYIRSFYHLFILYFYIYVFIFCLQGCNLAIYIYWINCLKHNILLEYSFQIIELGLDGATLNRRHNEILIAQWPNN